MTDARPAGSPVGRATVGRSEVPRVLAVCLGNICRSPLAAAAIREAAGDADLDIEVDSAGTADWNVGCPPDPMMIAVARAAGLTLDGSARQLTCADLDTFDLVLVMDHANLAVVEVMVSRGQCRAEVRLLRSFDPVADAAEVPDPWGGPRSGFEEVVELVRPAARGVVTWLQERST